MTQEAITIPKVRFTEPRRNLPNHKGKATAEDRFTIAFARAYFRDAQIIHGSNNIALAREIPINGYGIADLVTIRWQIFANEQFHELESFMKETLPCVQAFECKLRDWRKAMSQASRYNFFVNQAIVVVPEPIYKNAAPYIDTFRKIRVGLWGYSPENNRIYKHFTPRPTKPVSERYLFDAVRHVASVSRQALPFS